MHSLLGKGNTFLWTDSQEFEFKTLKTLLTKNMQTNHLDSSRDVHILTDALRHFGICFALVQFAGDHFGGGGLFQVLLHVLVPANTLSTPRS